MWERKQKVRVKRGRAGKRENYDVYPVVEMCKKFDPEIKYLADVLVRK